MTEQTENREGFELPKGGHFNHIGSNLADALEHANTPMAALAATYNHAPSRGVRAFINQKVDILLHTELPKFAVLMFKSPAVSTEDATGELALKNVYAGAIQNLKEHASDETVRAVTATIESCGEEIAEVLDRAIRRVAVGEDTLNREAFMDIQSAHSTILAALTALVLTDEQKAMLAEADGDESDS